MFRRLWSGLPKDVEFPSNLTSLGYFVNEKDEIRSIENPDYYFKFFLNRNERINQRQRFAFDHEVQRIVHERLEKEQGLVKIRLPVGSKSEERHVPIFTSPGLEHKSRVVVIVGESCQSLGILAGRVVSGRGGISEGSVINLVKEIKQQTSSKTNPEPPGIVLANTGELYWWPEGKRAITIGASAAIPLPSLAHAGRAFVPELNYIPGHESSDKHLKSLFTAYLHDRVREDAKIDIIAVGESCETVERLFDDKHVWSTWGNRLNSVVLLGAVYSLDDITNIELKNFLAKRACAYIVSSEAVNMPLAPPEGHPDAGFHAVGCPSFSSSEPHFVELIPIKTRSEILAYIQHAANHPDFENLPITIVKPPEDDQHQSEPGEIPDWWLPYANVSRQAPPEEDK